MPNSVFQSVVRARIEGVLAESDALIDLDHRLVIGRLRELLLENLIQPLAPPNYLVGTGIAMDHEGRQSGEIDLLVANRSTVPRMAFGARDALFPIESIVYAIEVKSTFKREHVDDAVRKFQKFRHLNSLPCGHISRYFINTIGAALGNPAVDVDYYVHGPNCLVPPTVIFAYHSRTNINEHLAYLHELNRSNRAAIVQVICVPKHGYWYWTSEKGWIGTPPDNDRSEILMFLAGITNTMFGAQSSYTGARFGNYLA